MTLTDSFAPVDLHIHTTYSDGVGSPLAILQLAAQRGIHTLAFTDHDSLDGYRAGRSAAEDLGITLLPGIEVTTCLPMDTILPVQPEIDLLGYGMQIESSGFVRFETVLKEQVVLRMQRMVTLLQSAGIDVSLENVLSENLHNPGMLALLLALQRKQYITDLQMGIELINRYIPLLPYTTVTIPQAIAAIHAAGGVAVLAHPVAVQGSDGWLNQAEINQLVAWGLDGIEIYHIHLPPPAVTHFLEMAQAANLLVSGGSDLHGWTEGLDRLGRLPVTEAMLLALQSRLKL